ncbi:hypothetical protein D3C85_1127870 [compost metagenome]
MGVHEHRVFRRGATLGGFQGGAGFGDGGIAGLIRVAGGLHGLGGHLDQAAPDGGVGDLLSIGAGVRRRRGAVDQIEQVAEAAELVEGGVGCEPGL